MPERNRFKLTPKNAPHDLDGSTFTRVLKSHGKDGRYQVLCYFLGRARALKAVYSWYISPKHALAYFGDFGHLAFVVSAKLILGRFRNAVSPDFSRFPADFNDYLSAFSLIPVMGDTGLGFAF